jgi:hypothetical protein
MGDTQREIEKSWMKDIRRSKKKYREILDYRYSEIRVGDP